MSTPVRHICIPGWGAPVFAWHDYQTAWLPVDQTVYIPWEETLDHDVRRNHVYTVLSEIREPLVLHAWSMGTLFALKAAEVFSDKVLAVIVLSGFATFTQIKHIPGTDPRQLSAMQKALERDMDGTLRGFAQAVVAPAEASDEDIERYVENAKEAGAETLARGLEVLASADMTELLPSIKAPLLAFHGDADRIIPPSAGVYIARSVPNGKFRLLEGVGHHPLRSSLPTLVEEGRAFVDRAIS